MSGTRKNIAEIEIIRALMIIWIFITHFYEHLNQGAFFGNPNQNWPPLLERIQQLKPFPVDSALALGRNIIRYLGFTGDQGVQVFILISGFVLTFGMLNSGHQQVNFKYFFSRRIARIYPAWILCHLGLMVPWFFLEQGISPISLKSWLSIAGLRILPSQLYYGSAAWWFIGCLIQLYVLFPFLYNLTIGRKNEKLLIYLIIAAVMIRLSGLLFLDEFIPSLLDYWSRGALFFSRLPEFLLGMLIAVQYQKNPESFKAFIRSPKGLLISLSTWIAGNVLSFFIFGMAFAFLFTGAGIFLLLWGGLLHTIRKTKGLLERFSSVSYEFYLVHDLLIVSLVPVIFTKTTTPIFYFMLVFGVSTLAALLLRFIVRLKITRGLFDSLFRFIINKFIKIVVIVSALCIVALVSELIVQRTSPQEVFGWGERPALQKSASFGFHLIPDKRISLRWQSYDYTVTANSMGFPGPEYAPARDSTTRRILVTGDAFESAEGVDTDNSWPRLLEKNLNAREGENHHQVLNLSITGWGPQHYFRVLEHHIPIYKPDVVLIGLFINDLTDVFITDSAFNEDIGFSNPKPASLEAFLKTTHLRKFLSFKTRHMVSRVFPSIPPMDYYLGHPNLIRKESMSRLTDGAELVYGFLKQIKDIGDEYNAAIYAILVPSSIQSADLSELCYLPKNHDYSDMSTFDIDQPQRILGNICDSLAIPYFDLRIPFSLHEGKGIYQPRNMHWTENGHRIVADWIKDMLEQDLDYIHSSPETN